jgi:hypothetical protein
VLITMSGTGVSLAAGQTLTITSIKVQADTPILSPAAGEFSMRAESGPNDLDGARNDCTLPVTAIPTLSERAQFGMALILVAVAVWHLRRRRTLRTA